MAGVMALIFLTGLAIVIIAIWDCWAELRYRRANRAYEAEMRERARRAWAIEQARLAEESDYWWPWSSLAKRN
jgi:hypothetical protein